MHALAAPVAKVPTAQDVQLEAPGDNPICHPVPSVLPSEIQVKKPPAAKTMSAGPRVPEYLAPVLVIVMMSKFS